MLRFDPARGTGGSRSGGSGAGRRFILYLEGPADRGILRAWAYRLLPSEARDLFDTSVILGGRQPARAVEHFRNAGGAESGARALCVLDRDDGNEAPPPEGAAGEPGLDFFTWSRRHIESYLLVPEAIRRAVGRREENGRLDRLLRRHLPRNGDERAYRDVDAKRLLGPRGVLTRELGRPIELARIARATREAELHADVHTLFARFRVELETARAPR